MGLTINKSVQTAAGAKTGVYLRLVPLLLQDGVTLQSVVASYYQKITFDSGLQTIPLDGIVLQPSYNFAYDRAVNGTDLLQLAQTWTKNAIIEANEGWTADDITGDTLN